MKSIGKYRIFYNLVILYLIAAFTWWAILLNKKNKQIYDQQIKLSTHDSALDLLDIEAEYAKNTKMIAGEGLVFGLTILIGLVLINRAFLSELKLNRQLNDFLLSVTHELKTPIASLKLATQTLRRKNLPQDQQQDLIQTNWEECLRLEAQVNNMLTAAQIEQSYTFNFEKKDISELLKARVQRFQKIYPNRDINDAGIMDGIDLQFDKEAMTKTIDNILHNALKYSPDDKPVAVKLEKQSQSAVIQISDQGIGITDKEKKKIWNKFYRSENEETRETQGTGLGLWIAKSVVKAHKGDINILDNKPKGSIFKLTIPINESITSRG